MPCLLNKILPRLLFDLLSATSSTKSGLGGNGDGGGHVVTIEFLIGIWSNLEPHLFEFVCNGILIVSKYKNRILSEYEHFVRGQICRYNMWSERVYGGESTEEFGIILSPVYFHINILQRNLVSNDPVYILLSPVYYPLFPVYFLSLWYISLNIGITRGSDFITFL